MLNQFSFIFKYFRNPQKNYIYLSNRFGLRQIDAERIISAGKGLQQPPQKPGHGSPQKNRRFVQDGRRADPVHVMRRVDQPGLGGGRLEGAEERERDLELALQRVTSEGRVVAAQRAQVDRVQAEQRKVHGA